ncbi:hypothetical protein GBF38_001874 [Nibea albiflora]|uniref:Uncharacterized protein n=1 Tax=Nibea albiflora TaxID=240163 RepID=A0ACB7EG48_NIBAL|nr:hypothetical protein GBF38_001874 [Nibea albiflora]
MSTYKWMEEEAAAIALHTGQAIPDSTTWSGGYVGVRHQRCATGSNQSGQQRAAKTPKRPSMKKKQRNNLYWTGHLQERQPLSTAYLPPGRRSDRRQDVTQPCLSQARGRQVISAHLYAPPSPRDWLRRWHS